jgi:glycosyltransferase involved in cell wall biosynthesis
MRITIVMGFFLPIPAVAGGATEKSWEGLAREFVAQGHEVIVVSRRWPNWPARQILCGVWHLRLPGNQHSNSLLVNLWRDFKWSCRVWWALPPADITIVNCVTLPVWLGRLRKRAGRIVLMPGRVPKGQYRLYGQVDRILAVSTPVRSALLAENPSFENVTRTFGYPIDWTSLSQRPPYRSDDDVVIGFVGRIHREKGLDLLVAALRILAKRHSGYPWRVVLCGPVDIARGGSGPNYAAELLKALGAALPSKNFALLPPAFETAALDSLYQKIDIFCYPSVAVNGETFGVAVAEAMAAGAVPVVSALPCFSDFVRDGRNGRVFEHAAPDAPERLAVILGELVRDTRLRLSMAKNAQSDVRLYDFPKFAARLLEDFSSLNAPAPSSTTQAA